MTRDKVVEVITRIDHCGYPWKHELHYLLDHDAEQRKEITRLREVLKRIENYAGENGCCPYGCDTPYIAKQALTQEPT